MTYPLISYVCDSCKLVQTVDFNIKEEILAQLEYTKEWNCKFITPIPTPTIIN